MTKILTDTSVWIDFLNAHDLPHVHQLEYHLTNSIVCICPPIIQEVLQGVRSEKDYLSTKDLLLTLEIFSADSVQAAVESAEIFRDLRKKGVTIRKSNDCLITWYALRNNAPLLQNDKDFQMIASHTNLQLL